MKRVLVLYANETKRLKINKNWSAQATKYCLFRKITLSIGNLLKNFLTKMSKGRLKKCHLPTIMSLSISYYNIEMVLFMLPALLLLFFWFSNEVGEQNV